VCVCVCFIYVSFSFQFLWLSRSKQRYDHISETLKQTTVKQILEEKLLSKFLFVHDGSVVLDVLERVKNQTNMNE